MLLTDPSPLGIPQRLLHDLAADPFAEDLDGHVGALSRAAASRAGVDSPK
jgi:hypothetical protein